MTLQDPLKPPKVRSRDSSDSSEASEYRMEIPVCPPSPRDAEASRTSFRRRSCFRTSWKKQTLYDGEIADGYEADVQSGSNIDSTPSPASPELPLSPVFPHVTAPSARSLSSRFRSQKDDDDTRRHSRRKSSTSDRGRGFASCTNSPKASRESSSSFGSSSGKDIGRQDSTISNDGEGIRIVIDDVDSSMSYRDVDKTSGKICTATLKRHNIGQGNKGAVDFGLRIGFKRIDDNTVAIVERVHAGTAASKAGIKRGYRLLRWDGVLVQKRSAEVIRAILEDSGDVVDVEYEVRDVDVQANLEGTRRGSFRNKSESPRPSSPSRRKLPVAPTSETLMSLPDIQINRRDWEVGIELSDVNDTLGSEYGDDLRYDASLTLTRSSSAEQALLLRPWMESPHNGGSSAPASLMPSRRPSRSNSDFEPTSSLPTSRRSSFVGEQEEIFINNQFDYLPDVSSHRRSSSFRAPERKGKTGMHTLSTGGQQQNLVRSRSLKDH